MEFLGKKQIILIRIFFYLCLTIAIALVGFLMYTLHTEKKARQGRNTWQTDDTGSKFMNGLGEYYSSSWAFLSGNWYYFDASGYAVTGSYILPNGYTYNFSSDGKYQGGWVEGGDDRYVEDTYRHKATGWYKDGDDTYFLLADGHPMTGECTVAGKKCYFDETGILRMGWISDDLKYYYINEDGEMVTEWQTIDGNKYYFESDGSLATGTTEINGKLYLLDARGQEVDKQKLLDNILETEETSAHVSSKSEGSDNSILPIGGYTISAEDKLLINSALNDINPNGNYQIGFTMIDITTGQGITYNPDLTVYSASWIKGLYMPALSEYKPETVERSATTYKAILEMSDNKSYSSIRKSYGREPLLRWCKEVGADENSSIYNYPQISSRTMALLWIKNYEYLNTDETGMKVAEWMDSPSLSAIYSVLSGECPENTNKKYKDFKTQSKAGWICEGHNISTTDGGIVYTPDNRNYIITITSNFPSDMKSLEVIVSALDSVHEHIDMN